MLTTPPAPADNNDPTQFQRIEPSGVAEVPSVPVAPVA